jgi:hypothetical protein
VFVATIGRDRSWVRPRLQHIQQCAEFIGASDKARFYGSIGANRKDYGSGPPGRDDAIAHRDLNISAGPDLGQI